MVEAGLVPVVTDEYFSLATSRVHSGDTAEYAVNQLSDAWFHGECQYHDLRLDIFFYGQRNWAQVTIIVIESVSENRQHVVTKIGSSEPNALAYDEFCSPALPSLNYW
jgi:hypothetical protein